MNINNNPTGSYAAILTVYNSADTIDEAISSILNQDVKPTEIWVVDDCSTDSTRNILEKWLIIKPDLKVILNPLNKGQSYSRNVAATRSTSDLLIFFDDDDISKSFRSREHLSLYSLGAELSYVSSEKVYDNGYVTTAQNKRIEKSKPEVNKMIRQLVIGRTEADNNMGWVPASTLAINAKTFNLIGGFDEKLRRLEDSDLAIRAAECGASFSWSDRICVLRKSSDGLDKGGIIETNNEFILLNRYRKFLSKREYQDGKRLIKLRSYYFGKRFFSLIFFVSIHPSTIFMNPIRILRFMNRMLHDFRKNS